MQITISGSQLIIETSSAKYSYPKERVSIGQKRGIEINYMGSLVHHISANTDVTNIASTSINDLADKLNLLVK